MNHFQSRIADLVYDVSDHFHNQREPHFFWKAFHFFQLFFQAIALFGSYKREYLFTLPFINQHAVKEHLLADGHRKSPRSSVLGPCLNSVQREDGGLRTVDTLIPPSLAYR